MRSTVDKVGLRHRKLHSGLNLIDTPFNGKCKFCYFAFRYHRPAMRLHHANRFVGDHSAHGRVTNANMVGKLLEGHEPVHLDGTPKDESENKADVRQNRWLRENRSGKKGESENIKIETESPETGSSLRGRWEAFHLGSVERSKGSIDVREVRFRLLP